MLFTDALNLNLRMINYIGIRLYILQISNYKNLLGSLFAHNLEVNGFCDRVNFDVLTKGFLC